MIANLLRILNPFARLVVPLRHLRGGGIRFCQAGPYVREVTVCFDRERIMLPTADYQ